MLLWAMDVGFDYTCTVSGKGNVSRQDFMDVYIKF